ncbi:MAG: flavin reductase family protein [Candidatus Omnitrophica bacterium]|nr:flavin reductase family protein [Candidatus Omnitrophota bacterium]
MKKEVDKKRACRLINSGNLILVSCSYKDKDNITTCAWHSPCSHTPACLLVALAKKHLSSELIRKSKEFIINIPSWQLKDKAVFCGSNSGRDIDKFQKAPLTREKALKLSKASKIKECIANIECSLIDIKEIGDHFLFFGEPVYAEVVEGIFDFDNIVWKEEADLLFHFGGKFFAKQGPFIS